MDKILNNILNWQLNVKLGSLSYGSATIKISPLRVTDGNDEQVTTNS